MNIKELIGKKIQNRRVEMGFGSQKALAEKLEIEPTQVSRWERGEALPDPSSRKVLCDVLEVDMAFFQTIDGPITRIELLGFIADNLPDLHRDDLLTLSDNIRTFFRLRGRSAKETKTS